MLASTLATHIAPVPRNLAGGTVFVAARLVSALGFRPRRQRYRSFGRASHHDLEAFQFEAETQRLQVSPLIVRGDLTRHMGQPGFSGSTGSLVHQVTHRGCAPVTRLHGKIENVALSVTRGAVDVVKLEDQVAKGALVVHSIGDQDNCVVICGLAAQILSGPGRHRRIRCRSRIRNGVKDRLGSQSSDKAQVGFCRVPDRDLHQRVRSKFEEIAKNPVTSASLSSRRVARASAFCPNSS